MALLLLHKERTAYVFLVLTELVTTVQLAIVHI